MQQTRLLVIAPLVALTLAATGCVLPDQMSQIQKDLADVQAEIQRLEQTQAATNREIGELSARVSAVPDRPKEALSAEDLAEIQFRLDQASRSASVANERMNDLTQQIDRMAEDLDRTRALALRGIPGINLDATTGLGDTTPAGGPAVVPVFAPGLGDADPDALYNTAYADFSKGNYSMAVLGFEEYFGKYPDSAQADNALYWVAECHFSRGSFPDAIRSFDRLLSTFPDSDKAAAANLKKGLAYLEQNQVSQAIVQLEHVRSTYSGSDEARVARDKLTSLGVPQ